MYLTENKSYIMHFISLINRYIENPKKSHLITTKKILQYLKGTSDFRLFHKKGEKSYFIGFLYGDYVGDLG